MKTLLGLDGMDGSPATGDLTPAIARRLFGTGAVLCVCGALAVALLQPLAPRAVQAAVTVAALLLAAGLAWASRQADGARLRLALVGTAWATCLLIMAVSFYVGQGLRTVTLAIVPMMVGMLAVTVSTRHAALMAGGAFAGVLGLGMAQRAGMIDIAARVSGASLTDTLVAHAIVLSTALVLGLTLAHFAERYRRSAAEREQRFLALLGISADAYWETDTALRVRAIWRRGQEGRFTQVPMDAPMAAWDMPALAMDPDAMTPVRAAMTERRRFREVPLRGAGPDGRPWHLVASGEPRFDADGKFAGYWGLVIDVTDEVMAEQTVRISEARYRQLFDNTPTPLLLHRDGITLEANPAAARLFGYDTTQDMIGQDVLAVIYDEQARQAALQRVHETESMPAGARLPMLDARARARDGRRLWLKSTAAPVQTASGPATLSLFIDETERRDAEDEVRRTQALLERVVAMSPDVITLTDMQTGRYVMVNDAFCRVTGYTRDEVIGRTSHELQVWTSPMQREQLVQSIRNGGVVNDINLDFRTRDGRTVRMRVGASRFDLDDRAFLVINARDTTETDQQRLERAAVLDSASVGIALTRGGQFVVVNPALAQMLGWPAADLLGQPTRAVMPDETTYWRLREQQAQTLRAGSELDVEQPLARRDGSSFLARLHAKSIDPERPLESGTVWIVEDVTQKRQFEQALARARDDAESANRAKSAFLANTSHEIRTPLNALVGLARLVREPDLDDERRRQYLDQIAESAEALSAVISDILDLSKIEAGKLELESVPFDLHELLRSLHRAYGALADTRGLYCTLTIGPDVPRQVRGDPLRVRQILANFLSNGLKFTADGGLALRVAPAGTLLRFEVLDTGPGIDAASQARLFRPFTQADDSTTRRYGGTGLGLSICRELAQRMGGEVGVVSAPGAGSCFWAELPLPEADVQGVDSEWGGLEADPLRGARVLMVEDNPVNMMIGVALLQRWGALVDQAGDGAQAVEMALRAQHAGEPFDLVLMDVQMPGMSGHEATRTLRRYFGPERLGIVAVTAAALVSERDQALAAGMDDFVTKPIDERRLHGTLVRVLARRGAR